MSLKDITSCPDCGSMNIIHGTLREQIICRDCGLIFEPLAPGLEEKMPLITPTTKKEAKAAKKPKKAKKKAKKVAKKKAKPKKKAVKKKAVKKKAAKKPSRLKKFFKGLKKKKK